MIVEPLSDEKEWDRFVTSSPGGTFYHSARWRLILESLFGVTSAYLAIRDDMGGLVGICPFVIRKELKVFKVLDSLLDSDYGGPLFKDGYEETAINVLGDYLKRFAHDEGIAYAKIRFTDKNLSQHLKVKVPRVDTSIGTMLVDLNQTPTDYIWSIVFSKKDAQRKYIRRFEESGYRVREVENIDDDWSRFYTLYHDNMIHVGGLPYDTSFFNVLRKDLYPDNFSILLVEDDQSTPGALGFYKHKDTSTFYLTHLGLDRSMENRLHTSYYLYWKALQIAEKSGYQYVSFGSTPSNPDELHRRLKSKFGAQFAQDYITYLCYNQKRFLIRETMATLWRNAGTKLPNSFKRGLLSTAEAH